MPERLRRRTRLPVTADEHGRLATTAQVRYQSNARRMLTATLFVGRRVRVERAHRQERSTVVGHVEAVTHLRAGYELLVREERGGARSHVIALPQVVSIEELGE